MLRLSSPLDVPRIRADFPILQRQVNGRPLVYLDNAASSQKPQQVIDALVYFYTHINANVHRGVHTLSVEATDAYEAARERVARFVGSDDPGELVFVRNATEGLNLVAVCWGRANLQPGDEILATLLEHHSNLVPWQRVAQDTGARIRLVPLRDDGTMDLDAYRSMLSPRTKVVALAHASNVLGTINPLPEIAELAHAAGAIVVVDGAQSVPHVATNVADLGIDFLYRQWEDLANRPKAQPHDGDVLQWMQTEDYLALAYRPLERDVMAPLRARNIPLKPRATPARLEAAQA